MQKACRRGRSATAPPGPDQRQQCPQPQRTQDQALAAFLTPYAINQLALQNLATTGLHSENPHLFDMAWTSVTLIVLAVLAALLPAGRSLVAWVAVSCLGFGLAGLAFGEGTTWSLLALAFGVVSAVAAWMQRRNPVEPSTEQCGI